MKKIIIGTRGSGLALAQTGQMRELLLQAHSGLEVEVRIIKTSGDMFQNVSLSAAGGKGLFTKEIEEQLMRGEVHIAVHSMKDLPTELPAGLVIGAAPRREDPRDVLITKKYDSLNALPQGARVATSSVRRRAQLLAQRPDLQFEDMRGNLDTRLRKLSENDALDATLLAAAGLNRLGIRGQWSALRWCPLDFEVMIPAVGQGIVAIEVREDDAETRKLIAALNDPDALACGDAERVFLNVLGGGCHVPFAGHATVCGAELKFIGGVFSPDGKTAKRVQVTGAKTSPQELGKRAAKRVQE